MHLSSFYIHDGKYYHVDQKCNLAEHPSVLQHKTCNIYFPEHLEHPPIPCTSVFFTALIVLFNPLHPNELWYLLPFSVIYTPVDASPYTHFSQSIKIGVKQAAYSAAKSAAEDTAVIPVLNTIKLKSDIIRLLGKERIERSIIVDGSEGISCWNSYLSSKTGEMNIHVKYEVRVPLPLFGNPSAKMEETFRIHGWTGYGKDKKTEDSEIVYITEKQSVYHEDYHCSYLQLSIRFVPYEQLEEIRNENGGIYYACISIIHIRQSAAKRNNGIANAASIVMLPFCFLVIFGTDALSDFAKYLFLFVLYLLIATDFSFHFFIR